MHPLLAQRWRLVLYLLLFAQAAAVIAEVVRSAHGGARLEIWLLVIPPFVVHAFSCLASWYVCRAVPLERSPAGRVLAAQAGSALVSSAVFVFATGVWFLLLDGANIDPAVPLSQAAPLLVVSAFFLYSWVAALHYLLQVLETSREAQGRAFELRLLAQEAELLAMRVQLDPHFLFNSLNSISALVASDPREARRMCLQLADFFRATLELGALRELTLSEEIGLARSYLAVEKVRFGERLTVIEELTQDSLTWALPPLLLQPLIENAVRHGIAHLLEGGTLEIRAAVTGGLLHVAVINPCDPDRPKRLRKSGEVGVGLNNVRQRLAHTYGGGARLVTEERAGRFCAELWIPRRRSDEKERA